MYILVSVERKVCVSTRCESGTHPEIEGLALHENLGLESSERTVLRNIPNDGLPLA